MEEKKSFLKKPQGILAIALVLIILGSFFAGLFHTSFYSVDISRINFEGDHGTMSALLYMPKGAGADDPRPVIVTTHGYLNTKEMQDAPAIEMSRRGYIVLAVDMYDHGDSRWSEPINPGEEFGTFWIYSQFDAAKYVNGQDYVKKDENGNAYIAVSGHSMGGFSSELAMYMDEMASLETGTRMIYAGIPVASDYGYTSMIAPQDQVQAAFGSRTVGMVAAHYDEFFFGKSDAEKTEAELEQKGSVRYKDFPATISGKAFLGLGADQEAGIPGEYYTVQSGDVVMDDVVLRPSQQGERIIFTPNETHPWNHFSQETTADLISFYTHAFEGVTSPNQTTAGLAPSDQIWFAKEFFSLVAMIGFFLLFVPLITLLAKLPVFSKVKTEKRAQFKTPETAGKKAAFWIVVAVSALIPALLFQPLMNKTAEALDPLRWVVLAAGIVAVIGALVAWVKSKSKGGLTGGIVIGALSLALFLILTFAEQFMPTNGYFNEPVSNQIAFWAVVTGLIAAIIASAFYVLQRRPAGDSIVAYGIVSKPASVLSALALAVVSIVIGYLILFAMQALFSVDFRFWTLAVRTFTGEHILTALRYIPIFLIYYFINSATLVGTVNSEWLKGWRGTLVCVLVNIGGLVLWLAMQYGSLFATGVGAFPTEALNGIVLIALVPCLGIAAVYARKLYRLTGNVWTSAFLNAILFTIIIAANTVMYWNMVG